MLVETKMDIRERAVDIAQRRYDESLGRAAIAKKNATCLNYGGRTSVTQQNLKEECAGMIAPV